MSTPTHFVIQYNHTARYKSLDMQHEFHTIPHVLKSLDGISKAITSGGIFFIAAIFFVTPKKFS